MIEEYNFGQITINGKNYQEDIGTDWKGIVFDWGREEADIVSRSDLLMAVEKCPESIVIGTGYEGTLKISEDAQKFAAENRIKLIVDKTEEAVKTFNILKEESIEEDGDQYRVVGLFHLTD